MKRLQSFWIGWRWRRFSLVLGGVLLLGTIMGRLAWGNQAAANGMAAPAETVALWTANRGVVIPSPLAKDEAQFTGNYANVDNSHLIRGQNCAYPSQYWQDHPETWPAQNVVIGSLSFPRANLVKILNQAPEDVKTHLLQQFLAAAFNVLQGADPQAAEGKLNAAGAWINSLYLKTSLTKAESQEADILSAGLEDYNQGRIGPGLCAGVQLSLSPTPLPTTNPTSTPYPGILAQVMAPTPARHKQDKGQGDHPSESQPIQPPPASPAPTEQPAVQPTEVPPQPPASPGSGPGAAGNSPGHSQDGHPGPGQSHPSHGHANQGSKPGNAGNNPDRPGHGKDPHDQNSSGGNPNQGQEGQNPGKDQGQGQEQGKDKGQDPGKGGDSGGGKGKDKGNGKGR